jgi:YggT family protein
MPDSIPSLIDLLFTVLTLLLVGRALLSWFDPGMNSSVGKILFDVTEPILGPIRRVLPSAGGIDFSPIIAIIALQFIRRIVLNQIF